MLLGVRCSLAAALALACAGVASGADELEPAPASAPVVVDGRVLFTVGPPVGKGATAEARALAIAQRVEKAARDRTLLMPSVTSRKEADGVSILAGAHLLIMLRPADAASAGLSLERYVELLVPVLEQAIRNYRQERRSANVARAATIAALVVALLAALLAGWTRLYRRLRLYVLRGTSRRLEEVEDALSGAIEVSRMRRALALALSAISAAVWVTALVAGAEACLALFPQTRGFASHSLGLLMAPLAEAGRALVASIPSLVFVDVVIVTTRVLLRILAAIFHRIGAAVALSTSESFGSSAKRHDWFAISQDEEIVIGDYDGDGRDLRRSG